jgi:signal transduction histidine kinase
MNWIKRYENFMLIRLIPQKKPNSDLEYLRNEIFLKCLIYIFPSGIIVLFPGTLNAIYLKQYSVLTFSILTYLIMFIITIPVRIPIHIKKIIFTLALFNLGFQLFFRLDFIFLGILYWTIANISIVLLYSKKTTLIIGLLNTLVCIFIGYLIYSNHLIWFKSVSINLDKWIIISVNMLFLNIIVSILINQLISNLQSVIFKEINSSENLKKSNHLLHAKNDELEHMTYVASHDLQEPLRMVTSFLTQLEIKYKDQLDQRGKQYIHFAMNGAVKMREVMLEILAFSKIGMDNGQLEIIQLNELVDEVLWMNRKLIQENNSQIIIEQLPNMLGHKILLRTLFTNLISNAVKYKSNARISIVKLTCDIEEHDYVFKIIDNGIGIHPEKTEQIFLLFNRGDLNNNQIQGSGIGLAICKKITLLMNGEISVYSVHNEGCTFTVRLPKQQIKTTNL